MKIQEKCKGQQLALSKGDFPLVGRGVRNRGQFRNIICMRNINTAGKSGNGRQITALSELRGGRTCSRASVEEFNLLSEFCYFSLFWLDYGQLKKLHTANSNSSTHADWAHTF